MDSSFIIVPPSSDFSDVWSEPELLSSKGHNLLGDKLYVKSKKITDKSLNDEVKAYLNGFPRQALHAQSLGFVHPRSGEKMFFESDLPQDLEQLQTVLQNL